VGRDWLFSLILHGLVIVVTIFAGPLDLRKPPEFADVIRVGVISMPEVTAAPVETIPDAPIPQAVEAEPEEVPIEDPTTKPAVEIEEPKKPSEPKPEPPKEEKPKPKPSEVQRPTGEEPKAGADEGQTTVETPTGGAVAGAMISNSEFTYTYWFTLAFNKINQNYRVPFAIDGRVECRIYFEVIKSGRVIDMRIVEPSGLPGFDDACMGAVGRAAPFPPLPQKYLPEVIGLTITFSNMP
jgi:protein TonB